MIPFMVRPAQMQGYTFFRITKSALFAGTIMLLFLFPFGGKANTMAESKVLPNNNEPPVRVTLELPETSSASLSNDTIPSRRGTGRRSNADTTRVLLPDTLPVQTVITSDSIQVEETEETEDTLSQEEEHSPLKATMLSATLPGLGQAYNGKYWKIPFLYAGVGGVIYAVDFNNRQYQHFRKNWLARVDGNPNTQDEYPNVPEDRLQREMNRWRRNVEISYIVGAALYIINILDATVDAHLLDFDVGEDLTLNVMPEVIQQNNTLGSRMNRATPGIRLSFRF